MANTRRTKQAKGGHLTVVEGTERPDDGGLIELRDQLAAAGAPAELLRALEGPGNPDEILQRLVEAGALPSPQESLTRLMDGWKPLLRRGVDPLDAELAGAEFLGMLRATGPDEDELPAMLTELVGQAEKSGTPEALAMLRVMAVLGPADVRPVAAKAADRLVAAGLADRPWVRELGSPEVGECFGYVDESGAQESIAVTFTYGRKAHTVVVLIDHDLGGGVKDCFATDGPDRIRADFRRAARQFGLVFGDYPPAKARAILSKALSAPPCPVAPDQVEDVHDYLDLLRTRVALLPDETTSRPAKRGAVGGRSTRRTVGRTVHKVKITLRGAKPPIWRRLEVPSNISLEQLHRAIQEAFGWEGYHMWAFTTPDGDDYGVPDPELGHRNAATTKLDHVAPRVGDRVRYTYDFGDDWEHDILIEDVLTAEPGISYPRCLGGRRACPPEDCGGIWGYAEMLEILADPSHVEHAARLEWLSLDSAEEFDPARFDRDEVNETLSEIAKVLLKR
jgi:hypothetical protein